MSGQPMPDVLIYGQFSNYWSNSNVSRGIAVGLATNGVDVQIYDRMNNDYKGFWKHKLPSGPDFNAPVGLFVGYPPHFADLISVHDITIGAFIAESTIIPSSWAAVADSCDLVVVPSSWVGSAYLKAGIPREKLLVVPHGLHPIYSESRLHQPGYPFNFLHISGARDFLDRKGTPQLIEAFDRTFSDSLKFTNARLIIRTPPSPRLFELVGATKSPDLFHIDESHEAFSPEAMWRYYHTNDLAALIQPSRAEAFGICPVEARSQAVPVILTKCAGHVQHAEQWDVVVDHGAKEDICVNGIPNGLAPTVEVDEIQKSLEYFVNNIAMVTDNALKNSADYAQRYDWGTLMRPLAKWLKSITKQSKRLGLRL